jgi:xylose isomerase
VLGFLERYDLIGEYFVNIEVNHATLGGHSFHHEVSLALETGIFGSVDANRGDPQNGWDTDQFPNSVEELSLALYEILRHGGLTTGGFNFDTKLRRQSIDRTDLFHGHIGGIDTLARSLLVAEAMLRDGALEDARTTRYAGWQTERGQHMLSGAVSLESLANEAVATGLSPKPVSGRQEFLEAEVNRLIWETPA